MTEYEGNRKILGTVRFEGALIEWQWGLEGVYLICYTAEVHRAHNLLEDRLRRGKLGGIGKIPTPTREHARGQIIIYNDDFNEIQHLTRRRDD